MGDKYSTILRLFLVVVVFAFLQLLQSDGYVVSLDKLEKTEVETRPEWNRDLNMDDLGKMFVNRPKISWMANFKKLKGMEKELGSDFKYFVFQAFFVAQHSSYRNFIGPYFIDSLDSVPSADVYYKSTTSRLKTAKKNLQVCCKNLKLDLSQLGVSAKTDWSTHDLRKWLEITEMTPAQINKALYHLFAGVDENANLYLKELVPSICDSAIHWLDLMIYYADYMGPKNWLKSTRDILGVPEWDVALRPEREEMTKPRFILPIIEFVGSLMFPWFNPFRGLEQ